VHRALRDLALAKHPAELARIADIADALRFCAKRARLGLAAQNMPSQSGCGRTPDWRISAKTARHSGGRPSTKPVLVENGFCPHGFGSMASIGSCPIVLSGSRKFQKLTLRWIEQAQQPQLQIRQCWQSYGNDLSRAALLHAH
jgi:hypothetical protein